MTDAKKGNENQDRIPQIPIYVEKPSIRVDVDIVLLILHYMMGGADLSPLGTTRDEYLKAGDISPDLISTTMHD